MPILRPFRALRYAPAHVPDLSAALCPPYDVISAQERDALLERHPFNAVRLESPRPSPGWSDAHDEAPYRQAARTLTAWRSEGVLIRDATPSIYLHEMRFRRAGDGAERVARGLMVRLRLEPLGPTGGVRPHEHTMSGPKEDRYRLLRATGTNLSPVVLLHESPGTGPLIDELTAGPAASTARDASAVEHRLWVIPVGHEPVADSSGAAAVRHLLDAVGGAPLTIADGHHRYETALRYGRERGQGAAAESDPAVVSDPAADSVLALIYAVEEAPDALATHRVVHDPVPAEGEGSGLLDAAADLFRVRRVDRPDAVLHEMADPAAEADGGRFGYHGPDGSAILQARRDRFEPLVDQAVPEAARWLDTSLLAIALRELAGIGPDELAGGRRVTYLKDPEAAVAAGGQPARASFVLDPTPVQAVLRVAEAGGVMPQKSTYFHPKAPTGLLFNPLEP